MRKNLLKSMLVALMAMVGTTAWAGETTTTYDFEDGNAVFTGRSRITVAIENDAVLGSNVVAFTNAANAQNGYSFADFNFSSLVDQAVAVNVEFDYWNTNGGRNFMTIGDGDVRGTTGGSSKTTYNSAGAIFRIGSDKNNFYINGDKYNLAAHSNKWLHVIVKVNLENKTVEYTITQKAQTVDETELEETVLLQSEEPIAFWQEAPKCSQIDAFGYINSSKMAKIDNLSITAITDDNAKFADYTIKYFCNETEIKEASTRNAKVGTTTELLGSDKDPIWNADNTMKYIYVSDDAAEQTVAEDGSTVVTVNFREAESWSYTLNAVYGGNTIDAVATGSVFEGESQGVTARGYYDIDGTLIAWKSADGKNYTYTVTPTQDDFKASVEYAATDLTNVVFFKEAEEIEGLEAVTSRYLPERFSNGMGAYAKDEAKAITTLGAGKYKIIAHAMGTQSACKFTMRAGSVPVWTAKTDGNSFYINNPGGGVAGYVFELTGETEIILDAAGGDGSNSRVTNCIDYIIIQQVTEVAEGDSVINVAGEESKYAAILAAIAELKAEIEAAEAIETEGKQDVDPFLAAIATAKTFLASEDVEAIQQAIADLKAAVDAFNAANAVSEGELNVTWIAAEDETIAAYTAKNTTVTDVVYNIDANTTVTIKQNDEANKAPLYNKGTATLRAYNGNTVVIKGNKLHKIVISPSNVEQYTAEGLSTEGSKFNAELKQVIWEGEANEVVFTCTKDGENYCEVGKIYVVYEDPEAVGID